MNILHGANFSALWEGMKYMYGTSSTKRSSYRPPLLRRAVFVLAFALGIAYGFVILDIALSIASTTISFSQLNDYQGPWPQLSRQINSSMCTNTSGVLAPGINLCGLQVAQYVCSADIYLCSSLFDIRANPFAPSLPEALRTLTNNSATNAVAFGDDGTAFIIPTSIPEDIAYYGSSFGVLSDCQSITPQCVGAGPSYGPGDSLTLSCPASASFNAALNTTTGSYPFGILDENGDVYATPYLVDSKCVSYYIQQTNIN